MTTFDWIIVGGGITGSALAYELVRQGDTVLLLERHTDLRGATRFGYGGIAYWSGTTALTRQLCAESKALYPSLSDELGYDVEFRELDLLLTIAPDQDPHQVAATYQTCAVPPQLVSVAEACALEPLLNPVSIAGALSVRHGHILPQAAAIGYRQRLLELGGKIHIEEVIGFSKTDDRITGVQTATATYTAGQVVVCAGALSRKLLQQAGMPVRLYFTHAELIETPVLDVQLQTMIMPAATERFRLEAEATRAELDPLWDESGHEPVPAILDAGVIQLRDGSLRIGQISRVLTDPFTQVNPQISEQEMRAGIGAILPTLRDVPGNWHHCLVAFSHDRLPLIGPLPGITGIHLFSGFSNPLALVPPLAKHFAHWTHHPQENLVTQLSPVRFL